MKVLSEIPIITFNGESRLSDDKRRVVCVSSVDSIKGQVELSFVGSDESVIHIVLNTDQLYAAVENASNWK